MFICLLLLVLPFTMAQTIPKCSYNESSTSPCNFKSVVNYTCCDPDGGTIYNWTNNVNQTIISGGYSKGVAIDIGFRFYFHTMFKIYAFDGITICSSGILRFDRDDCSYEPIEKIPNIHTGKFIAPFYTPLNGTINISTFGVKPYRMLVIQYDSYSPLCLGKVQMQTKLFETINHIETHYKTASASGHQVAIGISSEYTGLAYFIGQINPGGRTDGYPKDKTMIAFLPPIDFNDNGKVSDSGSDSEHLSTIGIVIIVAIVLLFIIMCLALIGEEAYSFARGPPHKTEFSNNA